MTMIELQSKKAYFDLIAPKYISWDFYSSYLNYDIPFGSFGDIVDSRTYRRFIPELNKRETAIEAFLRVVEYNISLVKDILSHEELVKEAELMFKYLVDLKALPSNRSRWVGGTTSVEKHPASIMNCSFLALNRLTAFGEIFELLCLGVGVGYRTFYKDINQLPNIKNKDFEIEFEPYNSLLKEVREENTYKTFNKDKTLTVIVGDSREGWRSAINILLSVFFYRTTPTKLKFNLNSVRPFGERIYGFGGTASGPEALENILHDIYHIIKNSVSDRLTALDGSDICCAIAKGVVAGSSRRSALLCLFEEDDDLMRNSKVNIPFEKSYRWQANITCAIGSSKFDEFIKLLETDPTEETVYSYLETIKPTKETLQFNFEAMKTFGEPGIDNYLLMVYKRYLAVRKYRPNEDWHQYIEVATNPCHEIIGTIGLNHNSGGFCNLTTGDLRKFIDIKNKKFDYKEAEKVIRLLTRIGLRQTNIQIPMVGWNQTQLEERLLGVDISNGFIEVCSILNWKIDSKKASNLRKKLREWANDEATKYSEKLGFKRPLLVTCVKPNGNTSTVLGSSAGIHWPWSKYYLRRVRMTSTDALAKTLIDQGYSVYPELYDLQKLNLTQESLDDFKNWNDEDQYNFYENQLKYFDSLDKEKQRNIINKCNAIVFEFPGKSYTDISANEITAIEQLENQRLWSIEYTDHLPSITITVKPNEWDSVCDWIYVNWNNGFITAAFMNYYDSKYSLLPYQTINEQEYKYHLSKINKEYIKSNDLGNYFVLNNDLLDHYEQLNSYKDKEDLDIGECKNGCPLK